MMRSQSDFRLVWADEGDEPMSSILQEPVPEESLLKTFRGGVRPDRWGHQGDCFSVSVDRLVSLADFVFAFYTSPVFRIERVILAVVAKSPSSDVQARAVAEGKGDEFAIWRVAERKETQLLMCDRYEKTRSWFRVVPVGDRATIMQFGSAVASRRDPQTGVVSMSRRFRWLMGFHVLYSRVLLGAARNRVMRTMLRNAV
jgi:hypothetical protein